MNRKYLAAPVLALVLLGCGPEVKYARTDPTVLTPKPLGYDVPFSYEVPSRAHRVLGEIQVTSKIKANFNATSTFDQVMIEMKKRARKAGADAIVDLKTIDSSNESRGELTMLGTFIIYTEPPDVSGVQ